MGRQQISGISLERTRLDANCTCLTLLFLYRIKTFSLQIPYSVFMSPSPLSHWEVSFHWGHVLSLWRMSFSAVYSANLLVVNTISFQWCENVFLQASFAGYFCFIWNDWGLMVFGGLFFHHFKDAFPSFSALHCVSWGMNVWSCAHVLFLQPSWRVSLFLYFQQFN